MDIRLITLDMDGTLLNSEGRLSEGNKRVIEEAMERGVHVAISTGRAFGELPKDVLALSGIEYAITSNGARVVRLENKSTIYTNMIEEEKMRELAELLFHEDFLIEFFFEGKVFVEKRCFDALDTYEIPKTYGEYILNSRTPIDDMKDMVYKNLGFMENLDVNFRCMSQKEELYKKLEEIEGITITSAFSHHIEIGGATTSKGDGVAYLCRQLGLEQAHVMACGDSLNDASMLTFAGIGVAMENASDEVKSLADFITKSNDDDGVAYAIKKFVLDAK